MSKLLTAADIEGCVDLPVELVSVPEWDGDVYVRSISAAERERWEKRIGEDSEGDKIYAGFAALVLCDEAGNRLFSQDKVEFLGRKSSAALKRIFDAGRRLNAMTEVDKTNEKKV